MANTNVFTGADGSLALAGDTNTAEGKAASDIIGAYQLTAVGRVQNVRVEVHEELRAFNEIGQRYPSELRPGNISIRGTIGRAYINGALLKLMLGEAATSSPAQSWMQPTFNISLMVENPAAKGVTNTLTLHDVKIDNWVYQMPEDDFLLESVGFQARYLSVEDKP